MRTTSYVGDGFRAEIMRLRSGFVLTIRDSHGHIVRRRKKSTFKVANDEMWRFSNRWRVVGDGEGR
jgi:hypothetical protein